VRASTVCSAVVGSVCMRHMSALGWGDEKFRRNTCVEIG